MKWWNFKHKSCENLRKETIFQFVYLLYLLFFIILLQPYSIYRTNIDGFNNDIKTWPLADLSGYFVIGKDSSNIAKICKYTNKGSIR